MKKEEIEKVKAFIGLCAINEKNPSNATKAMAYIQQYDKFDYNPIFLDSAKFYLSDKTTKDIQQNFESLIHLYFIKQDFSKIISYVNRLGKDIVLKSVLIKKSWDNADAWTLYRIGESYANLGNTTDSYLFYKKADQLAPFNPEFKNKLGASLMLQKNIPQAMLIFESVLKEDPKFVSALSNLGYANLISGNVIKAEALYDQGLKLDPDYETLLMNVAGLNIYKKDFKTAQEILKRILKHNPKNEQAKQVLEQLIIAN
jgi:tetratricopeptide (TPR) repeat protein